MRPAMLTENLVHQFGREQLRIFAKADAMFGMSFPYMSEIETCKRQKPRYFRRLFSMAASFLL